MFSYLSGMVIVGGGDLHRELALGPCTFELLLPMRHLGHCCLRGGNGPFARSRCHFTRMHPRYVGTHPAGLGESILLATKQALGHVTNYWLRASVPENYRRIK
jgi:hypothetical protein